MADTDPEEEGFTHVYEKAELQSKWPTTDEGGRAGRLSGKELSTLTHSLRQTDYRQSQKRAA